jgi:phosphoadenosine phosphosulfate reductase
MKLLREVEAQVNRPFADKLIESKEAISKHLEEFEDKCAVAFSGGKDSEVVLRLCLQQKPDIPVVFNNTGVEYPETVNFVAQFAKLLDLNLIVTHPEKSFWDCVKQYGFASGKRKTKGNYAQCCYWLKEKPMRQAIKNGGWLGYFTGETASENRSRMFWARDRGMCFHLKRDGVCKVKPILWWTEAEVWQFIKDNHLPFNGAYSRGAKRVGCMPCTAYKDWEEQMQKVNPKLYSIIKLRKDNQYVMALE